MCLCTPTFILVSQCCSCMKPFMFSLPSSYTQYSSCTDAFALWWFLFMVHHRFRDTSSSPAVAVAFQSQRHSESSLIRGQYDLIHLFISSFQFYGVSWRHVPSTPYLDSLEAFRFTFRLSFQIELFWVFSPTWLYSVEPYGLTVPCIPYYYIMICSVQVQISVMG